MTWLLLLIFSSCFGPLLSCYITLDDAAVRMTCCHRLSPRATLGYHRQLVPAWLVPALVILALLIGLAAALIYWNGGFWAGVGATVIGTALPFVWQARIPPRRGSPLFLRQANRRLLHVARSGDGTRARTAGNTAAQLRQAHAGLALDGDARPG